MALLGAAELQSGSKNGMSWEGGGHSVAVRHLTDCVRAKVYTSVCVTASGYISVLVLVLRVKRRP